MLMKKNTTIDKKKLLDELIEKYKLTHKKSEERFKKTSRFQVKGGSHKDLGDRPLPRIHFVSILPGTKSAKFD